MASKDDQPVVRGKRERKQAKQFAFAAPKAEEKLVVVKGNGVKVKDMPGVSERVGTLVACTSA